jgi:hypothetical protein
MIYQIQEKDIHRASQVLGKSFIDYPVLKFIFPDDQYRRDKIFHLFNFLVKLGMLNGEVVAPTENIEGVIIWVNPNNIKSSFFNILQAGFINLAVKIDLSTLNRIRKFYYTKQKIRSNIIKNSYYLLDVIGIDTQFQKKGFGRLLIETKLIEIDKTKKPCYVETSEEKNILFYKKFGFNLIHEYELMALKVFCLYRESLK